MSASEVGSPWPARRSDGGGNPLSPEFRPALDQDDECVCGHSREDHTCRDGSIDLCLANEVCECDKFRSLNDASETAWMEGRNTL
jgi:hypothetical protein